MDSSSKITALLLISMFFISSAAPHLDCGSCSPAPSPPKHKKKPETPGILPPILKPPINLPPVTLPPINPPVTLPPIVKPPITLPPIIKPPVTLPPVTVPPIKPPSTLPPILNPPITLPPIMKPPIALPPIVNPPITLPPVTVPPIPLLPPITIPPVTVTPSTKPPPGKPCRTPPAKKTCPIDTLKFGACVDLLGGVVHIGLGDPVVNKCCPVLSGLVEMEAAACLCTTLKLKALNLQMYVPIALELLITCGKTPPPGFTCSL